MLGGARSGKSRFAEERALRLGGGENVLYVATAIATAEDADLLRRVQTHRERRPPNWGLLELSGGELGPVLRAAEGCTAVLFDSLTLWVSARMLCGESGTLEEFDGFLEDAGAIVADLILVSDEVGLGVVPESAKGREFRDLLGLVNQRAAAAAEEVYLCVAGIPWRVK